VCVCVCVEAGNRGRLLRPVSLGGGASGPRPRGGGERRPAGGVPTQVRGASEPRVRTGAVGARAGHPETLKSEEWLVKVKVKTVIVSK